MITYSDPEGPRGIVTATAVLPWPTNDTGGATIRTMQNAVVQALRDAGTPTTARPAYQDLRRGGALGWEFVFTAPVAVPPTPDPEV